MEFLRDITESRMYRRLEQVRGTDVTTLGSLIFDHMLMLRLLYYINKPRAVKYAKETMKQQNFTSFRQSMPDLYNFLALVTNQKEYANMLFNDWAVVIPELRLKRVLRSVADGNLDERDYDSLMMVLQRRFKGLDGDQMYIRRLLSDWEKRVSPVQQKQAITRILQTVRRPINTDLYMLLQASSNITPKNS